MMLMSLLHQLRAGGKLPSPQGEDVAAVTSMEKPHSKPAET